MTDFNITIALASAIASSMPSPLPLAVIPVPISAASHPIPAFAAALSSTAPIVLLAATGPGLAAVANQTNAFIMFGSMGLGSGLGQVYAGDPWRGLAVSGIGGAVGVSSYLLGFGVYSVIPKQCGGPHGGCDPSLTPVLPLTMLGSTLVWTGIASWDAYWTAVKAAGQ